MAINFAFKILWLAPRFLKFFSPRMLNRKGGGGGWDILGIGEGVLAYNSVGECEALLYV